MSLIKKGAPCAPFLFESIAEHAISFFCTYTEGQLIPQYLWNHLLHFLNYIYAFLLSHAISIVSPLTKRTVSLSSVVIVPALVVISSSHVGLEEAANVVSGTTKKSSASARMRRKRTMTTTTVLTLMAVLLPRHQKQLRTRIPSRTEARK